MKLLGESSCEELARIMGEIAERPIVKSFLVAPDVFDRLRELPLAPPGERVFFRADVHLCEELRPGTVVPLDQHGRPLPKPKDGA